MEYCYFTYTVGVRHGDEVEYFYGIMDKPILGITISRFLSIDFKTGKEYLNPGCLGEACINN